MRCDGDNKLLGMFQPEREVPVHQGDKQAHVVYQASAGLGEANRTSQEGELASTVHVEYARGADGC